MLERNGSQGGKRFSFVFFLPVISRDSSPWLAVSLLLGPGMAKTSWWKGMDRHSNARKQRERACLSLKALTSPLFDSIKSPSWLHGATCLQAGSFTLYLLLWKGPQGHIQNYVLHSSLKYFPVESSWLIMTHGKPIAHLASVSHNSAFYIECTVTLNVVLPLAAIRQFH